MTKQIVRRSRRHVISMAATAVASMPLLVSKAQALGQYRPPHSPPSQPVSPVDPGGHNPGGSKNAPCFLRGTRIRTPAGDRRVEDLRAGDMVATLAGRSEPIRWIGVRRFRAPREGRRHGAGLPVRVARAALGEELPKADLYLSPDHALYLGGTLIPVKYLENGTSVAAALPDGLTEIEYFHIECGTHQVIFAEGAAVETLLVYEPQVRERFSNFAEHQRTYGADAAAMVPFAPVLRYNGVGAEMKALARLIVSTAIDVRDPIQLAYDRIADRAEAMALPC